MIGSILFPVEVATVCKLNPPHLNTSLFTVKRRQWDPAVTCEGGGETVSLHPVSC